ncbi:MAG: NAD(P)H-binding protein [Proteobacteria bacterium]|nr:NAD(P)H-binding protein [Pseudomonadota bacterium]
MTLAHDPRSRPARGTGELLVTGATGFLGQRVCRLLKARKVEFRALVRLTSVRSAIEGTGAWMVEGDLTKFASLAAALEGVTTVLHLAGVVREADPEINRDTHVHGTRNLLTACQEAGVKRVVAISSDTVLRADRDAYAQSKADAEQLLAHWDGGEAVVLRPPMMLGAGSPHLDRLLKLSRLPVVPKGPGRRPVGVDDVAAAAVAAALDLTDAPDEPIDLVGPDRVTLGELVALVAEARGARMKRRTLKLGALERRFAPEPEVDDRLARELLGWDPKPLREVLTAALESKR